MNRILITGSGGFLGSYLYRLLSGAGYSVIGVDRVEKQTVSEVLDISDKNALVSVLDKYHPEVIAHIAAFSNVELCEKDRKLAFNSNILPTAIIADWAGDTGSRVIFISSDYVFDGSKGNYSEEDAVRPVQNYGMTKLFGEKLVSALANSVILRPTVIYGWDPEGMNFFMQLYRDQLQKNGKNVPIDQINNPIYVEDLCGLIKKIIERPDISGTYMSTGAEIFNRYDFAVRICERMGWDKNILKPVRTEFLGQVAKRPLNNSTDSKKIRTLVDFSFNTLDNNLDRIKALMKQ